MPPQPSAAPGAQNVPQDTAATPSCINSEAAAAPPVPPPAVAGGFSSRREPTPTAAPDEPVAERRHPLRFVWHMDADGRFGVGSDEFIELVGPRTMAAFGRLWSEIAAELKLDPDNQVARAVATRETWSGIVISWPVDDTERAACR